MAKQTTSLCAAILLALGLVLGNAAFAGHHEAGEKAATEAGSAMTEKAKRAGAKGASTGADSMMKGSTVQDSAKKGGAAAVDEALKPAAPEIPAVPGAVSAPAPE